jgi:hypothetical protein
MLRQIGQIRRQIRHLLIIDAMNITLHAIFIVIIYVWLCLTFLFRLKDVKKHFEVNTTSLIKMF